MQFRTTTNFLKFFGFLFFLILIFLSGRPVNAGLSITVTGNWHETIDKNDLTFGAGSDLESTYTSISGQVSIDISGATDPNHQWRVEVGRSDNNWDNNVRLYIMRTSDGSEGSVSGGETYQEVTHINDSFFTGVGNVTGIRVQLRAIGASVRIIPGTYSTVLYYTVIDNP